MDEKIRERRKKAREYYRRNSKKILRGQKQRREQYREEYNTKTREERKRNRDRVREEKVERARKVIEAIFDKKDKKVIKEVSRSLLTKLSKKLLNIDYDQHFPLAEPEEIQNKEDDILKP